MVLRRLAARAPGQSVADREFDLASPATRAVNAATRNTSLSSRDRSPGLAGTLRFSGNFSGDFLEISEKWGPGDEEMAAGRPSGG